MVFGNSSKFTEGFTSFTADDDLMIANLKQALNYSRESVAIPDPSINITNVNPTTTKSNLSSMNSVIGGRKNNTLPTNISDMGSGIPTTTPSFTMPTQPMPTNTEMASRMAEINITKETTTTSPQMTMAISTKPATTKPSGEPTMRSSISGFKDIKRVMNNGNEDEEDDEDDEDAVLEEEDRTNAFEEESKVSAAKKHSTTRRHSEKIEGFRGSIEIESKEMRNILLALLLSCIGYLIVYSMGNNLLPLDEISPQLKKFKRLIYAGLFFLITYICLEVF
jgi:hypothetical protein